MKKITDKLMEKKLKMVDSIFYRNNKISLLSSIIYLYLVVLIITGLKKIFLISTGSGDHLFSLFRLFSDYGITELFSLPVFVIGSVFTTLFYPLIFILSISIYMLTTQVVLTLFSDNPARFSTNLAVNLSSITLIYPLLLIPIVGNFIYFILFIYFLSKNLARFNKISNLKGVFFACFPILIILLLSLIFSFVVTAVFFLIK